MHSVGGLLSLGGGRGGLKAEIIINVKTMSSSWLLLKRAGSSDPLIDFFPMKVALFKAGAAGRSKGGNW